MGHPLLCWDICQEGIHRRLDLKYDLDILKKILANKTWNYDASPESSLIWENRTVLITDCWQNIIHATANIYAMNGYYPKEVIGKKPFIFQGKKTEVTERKKIKEAIVNGQPFESSITNYKKDGSIYRCEIEAFPLFDKRGRLMNFIALEKYA